MALVIPGHSHWGLTTAHSLRLFAFGAQLLGQWCWSFQLAKGHGLSMVCLCLFYFIVAIFLLFAPSWRPTLFKGIRSFTAMVRLMCGPWFFIQPFVPESDRQWGIHIINCTKIPYSAPNCLPAHTCTCACISYVYNIYIYTVLYLKPKEVHRFDGRDCMMMQEKKPPPLKKAKIEAEFKRQVRTCKNKEKLVHTIFIPYHRILPSRSIQSTAFSPDSWAELCLYRRPNSLQGCEGLHKGRKGPAEDNKSKRSWSKDCYDFVVKCYYCNQAN